MSITVEAGDPRLSWRGAVSLERGHGWVKAWRIPFDDRILFQEDLRERAAMAAGGRLAFRTSPSAPMPPPSAARSRRSPSLRPSTS
jgi:hypothetical protein